MGRTCFRQRLWKWEDLLRSARLSGIKVSAVPMVRWVKKVDFQRGTDKYIPLKN